MTQEAFGAELRKEREARQISLQDIFAATRINIRFLEAIEEGRFDVLPTAYIRAFVREYAVTVGLNPDELLAKLDASSRPAPQAPAVPPPVLPEPVEHPKVPRKRISIPELGYFLSLQNAVLAVLAVVAIVLIISMIRWGAGGESSEGVTEIPFDKVVEESAAGAQKRAAAGKLPGVAAPRADSLTLEIQTRDSVWMSLVIDGVDTSEYLFGPERSRSWKARDRFVVSVGNPSGAAFRLNGVQLGPLAGPDGRIRNRLISAADLRGR
jgi:transcriptional regulator with XRE-family HTH domain